MRLSPVILRAAADTAQLAQLFGGSEDAVREAIAAAIRTSNQELLYQIIEKAVQASQATSADGMDPGVSWILAWFADELRKLLPPDVPYVPADGDCIQVTFTGTLARYRVSHPSMDEPEELWELQTDAGVLIPLSQQDFESARVEKLLGGGDEEPS